MKSVSKKIALQMGWEKEAGLWALIRLWQETFGDPVGRVSYPLAASPGNMVVACESALWKRELTFLLPELKARLAEVAPDYAGREIVFWAVRPFIHPMKPGTTASGPSRKRLEDLWVRAREISSALPAPLQSRGQMFVFRQLVNGTIFDRKNPL